MKKRILSLLLALILVLSLLPTTVLAGPSIITIDNVEAFVQYPIAGGHPDPYHGGIATEDDAHYYVDEIHFFEIDENGNFVNPKPIGNNAANEELIEFFEGDWH